MVHIGLIIWHQFLFCKIDVLLSVFIVSKIENIPPIRKFSNIKNKKTAITFGEECITNDDGFPHVYVKPTKARCFHIYVMHVKKDMLDENCIVPEFDENGANKSSSFGMWTAWNCCPSLIKLSLLWSYLWVIIDNHQIRHECDSVHDIHGHLQLYLCYNQDAQLLISIVSKSLDSASISFTCAQHHPQKFSTPP